MIDLRAERFFILVIYYFCNRPKQLTATTVSFEIFHDRSKWQRLKPREEMKFAFYSHLARHDTYIRVGCSRRSTPFFTHLIKDWTFPFPLSQRLDTKPRKRYSWVSRDDASLGHYWLDRIISSVCIASFNLAKSLKRQQMIRQSVEKIKKRIC